MISSTTVSRRISIVYSLLLALISTVFSCNSEKKTEDQSVNHLSQASSPYLLEHADNPVNWYEWGDEALAKAKKENKPVIISIGYTACHWCHVMESETFMDTAVANYMNEHFVAIKVDREERPDLDEIYVNATLLISGNAGWPLNAFALPDGKPFYAGTYFQKSDWLKLLKNIQKTYINDKASILSQSDKLTKEIQGIQTAAGKVDTVLRNDLGLYEKLCKELLRQADFTHGGFKGTPKFPNPIQWELLLQAAYLNQDKNALDGTKIFLDHLASGGIYDQLGGGFCRYATDEQWHIPHFEKMLYDNAQLVSLYAHAYQYTGEEKYRAIIIESLAFVKRELTHIKGGFYASINADSEGEEGKFYTWKYDEIAQTLDPSELAAFKKSFTISPIGNWEKGYNILYKTASVKKQVENKALISKARSKLFNVRAKRMRPSLDDKILTSWNALMLKGFVDAYRALGDPTYLNDAIRNARFLEKYMLTKDFRLKRSFRKNKVTIDGFIEDYAFLADAMLHLYQSTFDKHWLIISKRLTDKANVLFQDSSSPFYTFNASEEKVLVSSLAVNDGVIPSANAVMALTQYRLGKILYDEIYEAKAAKMLDLMKAGLIKNISYQASWARLLGMFRYGTFEVVILGDQAAKQNQLIQKNYLPNVIFAGGKTEDLPTLKGKKINGLTRIYVCKEKVCKTPTDDAAEALKMIRF